MAVFVALCAVVLTAALLYLVIALVRFPREFRLTMHSELVESNRPLNGPDFFAGAVLLFVPTFRCLMWPWLVRNQSTATARKG